MEHNKPITYERFLELKKAGDCVFWGDEEISLKDVCDYDENGFWVIENGNEIGYLFCDVYEFSEKDRKKMDEQNKKVNDCFNAVMRKFFDETK